jgi:hypothetical protein
MHEAKKRKKNCLYLESDRSVMEMKKKKKFKCLFLLSLSRVEKILKNDIVKDILCRLKLK